MQSLSQLSPSQLKQLQTSLSTEEKAALLYRWEAWRRPEQAPPKGAWTGWLIDAGRGWGKTRTGAETVRAWIAQGVKRIGIVSQTAAENRDIVVEGESGLLSVCPPWDRPTYEPSKRRVTWPNGAYATLYDASEPDQLRGPQHEKMWFDELAKYRYAEQVFDMAMFGLRLGSNPQWVATTTPLPTPFFKALLRRPDVIITKGKTVENLANLSPTFRAMVVDRYKGTRLGRQELDAELIDDVVGALWTRRGIEDNRVTALPTLKRVVVAIDPATTSKKTSNEHGIVTVGLGVDNHGYVIDDVSDVLSPDQMARRALGCYARHKADAIVVETNNGGDFIPALIKTIEPNANVIDVRAARGKVTRAEPISALYDQGRVHHAGTFPALEDQMTAFTREVAATRDAELPSPDRVDALVWGLTELFPDVVEVMTSALTYDTAGASSRHWMSG